MWATRFQRERQPQTMTRRKSPSPEANNPQAQARRQLPCYGHVKADDPSPSTANGVTSAANYREDDRGGGSAFPGQGSSV